MMNFYKKVQKPNFLPYKQRVTGSNPVAPTSKIKGFGRSASGTFLYFYQICRAIKVGLDFSGRHHQADIHVTPAVRNDAFINPG